LKLQWKRFHEYQSATTSSISLSIGENLFSSIIKILEKYLTVNIVTAIKEEISQSLYLQATIVFISEIDFIQNQVSKFKVRELGIRVRIYRVRIRIRVLGLGLGY
jgi:hypothetical protein